MGEIPDPRHGKANIADYIGQPVNEVGLVTHVIPESLPGVGVGSARSRVDGRQFGEGQRQSDGPHACYEPSEQRNAADGREVGRQHKHSRSHHVARNHQRSRNHAYFIAVVLSHRVASLAVNGLCT